MLDHRDSSFVPVGLSWSVGALIAFRVLQGLGGGMIMPLGQGILAQVAGPQRMGRVMSIIGVPMLLAPIFGPLIGGSLIAAASWHWIFFVNIPVGLVAVALAVRLLPASGPRRPERLDARGLVLLSGGLAVSLYGLAEAGQHARLAVSLGPLAAGAVLVAMFAAHARRAPNPLIDVRLFARRGFGSAAAANFVLGVALFGVALLLPLYFEILRGRSPLETGVLLAPQGLGAACAISVAGFLTDKVGARRIVPFGVALALAGTAMYARIGISTPYWSLALALFLVGAGLGATITPSMAAAFQDLPRAAMGHATSAINVVQRVAGSVGSALLAVVLQGSITSSLPGFRGGIGQAAALAGASPRAALAVSHAFAVSFGVALGLSAVALVPAALLPGRARAQHSRIADDNQREKVMSQPTSRPAGRRMQATVFRIVNVPMRAMLGLPFPTPLGGRLMLLYLTGRKTGKRYRQPVSYVRDGDELLTPGGGRWRLNLRDGEPVRIRLRGRDLTFRPYLVGDPDEVERLLGVMAAASPSVNRFVRIPRAPDGHLDRSALAGAVRYGFRIVTWRPA